MSSLEDRFIAFEWFVAGENLLRKKRFAGSPPSVHCSLNEAISKRDRSKGCRNTVDILPARLFLQPAERRFGRVPLKLTGSPRE